MNRRELLVGGAAVSAAALASAGQMFAQGGSAVFNGAGGSWQDNARRAWLEPFEKSTGTKVVDTSPFDIGKLSTMVRTRTVSWDLTDCPSVFVPLAMKNDLLDPIDYAVVDKDALPAENYATHAVAYGVFTSNIVYDRRKLTGENVPKSWRDFWDLKRFPGPRAMRNQPLAALEAALIADGVPAARLYPLDVERAFRKLGEIKSEMRWWSNAQQGVQLIANGEVVMGVTFPSRAFAARAQGVPLEVVWNEGLIARNRFVVPKGAANKAAAMRLLNFIIQPEQQANFANRNRSAPTSQKAFKDIDPQVALELATSPENIGRLIRLDELGYWAEHGEALTRRFEAWLLA
jgi:putative spermidine/putrescine transport system substrate-binding protein